jgi:hypothetical protein
MVAGEEGRRHAAQPGMDRRVGQLRGCQPISSGAASRRRHRGQRQRRRPNDIPAVTGTAPIILAEFAAKTAEAWK